MRVCLFRHSPVLQMQALVSLPPDYTLNVSTLIPLAYLQRHPVA